MAIQVRLKTEYELKISAAQLCPSLCLSCVVFEVMPVFSSCLTPFFYLTQLCRSRDTEILWV